MYYYNLVLPILSHFLHQSLQKKFCSNSSISSHGQPIVKSYNLVTQVLYSRS